VSPFERFYQRIALKVDDEIGIKRGNFYSLGDTRRSVFALGACHYHLCAKGLGGLTDTCIVGDDINV
jgi:hypothetical protein